MTHADLMVRVAPFARVRKVWREHIQIIIPVAASIIPVTNAAKHENSRKSSSTRPMAHALSASVPLSVRRRHAFVYSDSTANEMSRPRNTSPESA